MFEVSNLTNTSDSTTLRLCDTKEEFIKRIVYQSNPLLNDGQIKDKINFEDLSKGNKGLVNYLLSIRFNEGSPLVDTMRELVEIKKFDQYQIRQFFKISYADYQRMFNNGRRKENAFTNLYDKAPEGFVEGVTKNIKNHPKFIKSVPELINLLHAVPILSVQEMAKKCNISQSTISRMQRDNRDPNFTKHNNNRLLPGNPIYDTTKKWVDEGLSPSEIVKNLGYNSLSQLSYHIRKHKGYKEFVDLINSNKSLFNNNQTTTPVSKKDTSSKNLDLSTEVKQICNILSSIDEKLNTLIELWSPNK